MTTWAKTIWSTRDVGLVLADAIGIDIEDVISLLEDDEQAKDMGIYNHWLVNTADATYEVTLYPAVDARGIDETSQVKQLWSAYGNEDIPRFTASLIQGMAGRNNLYA